MDPGLPKPIVVAEIGNLHLGSLEQAKFLAKLAKDCGADYVKSQKRNPVECVSSEIALKPHPNPRFAYGKTYLEHRQNLELTFEQHLELNEYCKSINIKYATSVWDLTSAKEMIKLDLDYIKIPSPCNLNFDLIQYIFDNSGANIHISLGMVYNEEWNSILKFVFEKTLNKRFVLYHCTSEYPCPFERVYLRQISEIKAVFGLPTITCGFSNHARGIAVDIAAYILGAQWIERHFTSDRTILHSDAAASLEPDGLRRLCRDLKATYQAYQYKPGITEEEIIQRKKLRKN